ncbi:unnamed protein product, partial [Prorocentrum cordatum]
TRAVGAPLADSPWPASCRRPHGGYTGWRDGRTSASCDCWLGVPGRDVILLLGYDMNSLIALGPNFSESKALAAPAALDQQQRHGHHLQELLAALDDELELELEEEPTPRAAP